MPPFLARFTLCTVLILLPTAVAVVWWLNPESHAPKASIRQLPVPPLNLPQVLLPTGTDPASVALRHSIQQGERIYQRLCYHCHGRQGRGNNNPYMDSIGHAPANHADPITMQKLSDDDFFIALRDGVKDKRGWLTMPPWSSVLTEAEMWNVIAYVRRLPRVVIPPQPTPISPRRIPATSPIPP